MTEDETLKELIEDLISAMEYHVEQTRQIHSTTVALQAAREALKALAQQAEPVVGVFDYKEHAEGLQRDYDLLLAEYNNLKAQQVEPVAWAESDGEGGICWTYNNCFSDDPAWHENPMPLYTSPPPRQPLTDEEISNLWDSHTIPVFGKTGINPIVFARAIEAKFKEKI